MKVSSIENDFWTTDFSMQNSLNSVSELLKKLLTRTHLHEDKMSYWQLILLQSKANGCFYHDKNLPQQNWEWPKNTWFQERLSRHLQALELGTVKESEVVVPFWAHGNRGISNEKRSERKKA
jgi:hypothetical protein